jgi:hypothetical protein
LCARLIKVDPLSLPVFQMEFRDKDSFSSFAFSPAGDQINGRLLATFDATGVAGGNFRVVCAAARPVNFCFPGASLFVQPQLAGFEFIAEIEPEELYFPHNLLSTGWEDLSAAVAEKRIKVFHPAEPQQDETSFRSLLHHYKDDAHACFRWTICTHDDLSFSLDMQGLPMSAASASSKQALSLDTAPTIKLASHAVIFPPFPSGLHIPGPAPVVFSDDPDKSKSILTHQSPLLRHEMARLSWHFTSREYITLQTARLLSSTPKEGHFSRPLCAAVDHHPSPSTSQEFFSTPAPTDPAAGKSVGSEKYSVTRKYSSAFPLLFQSAIRSALSQQLSCPIDSPLLAQAESQLAQSVSSATWKRHVSAWNSFNSFLSSQQLTLSWPLSLPVLRQFTLWAHSSRQLNPHTIEAYLSSLSQLHQMLGFPNLHARADFLIQSFLKGSAHSRLYEPIPSQSRRTVTFSILKLIGHQISSSPWSLNSQLTVWSTALVAF